MHSHRPWFWLVAPALGALAGLLYSIIFDVGTLTGSAIRGVFIGSPILLYERGFLFPRLRDRIRRAATPLFAIATLMTYAVMILLGNAAAGTVLHHLFGYMPTAREAMMMSGSGFLYSLGISTVIVCVFRVRDLIGPGLFTSLLLGRYHRPISEARRRALLGDDPRAILAALKAAVLAGASPADLGRSLAYAAALRVAALRHRERACRLGDGPSHLHSRQRNSPGVEADRDRQKPTERRD